MTGGSSSNCIAKLTDGRTHFYDYAGKNREDYSGIQFMIEYLGEGVVYSVNDVLQNSEEKLHFWIRK